MKTALPGFLLVLVLCTGSVLAAGDAAPVSAPAPSTLSEDQLLANLTRQLSDRYQIRGELKLDLPRAWIPPAPVSGGYQVELIECPARLTSSLLLLIRLQGGGHPAGEMPVAVQAQVFRNVYVARTPLDRDAAFDPSQLDVRRVDVLRERDAVPVDDSEGDFTYATSVQAGRLLIWRDLAKRALVRRGQIIEVSAVDGSMTVTTRALAMDSGAAGDPIRVRNLTSRKDFTAFVVAEARAEVRF